MNILDASLFDNNPDYNDEEYVKEVYGKTEQILKRVFPDSYQKQKIKKEVGGLNIACPYCHDSASQAYKKRGHLIFNGKWSGNYKCFNCGAFTTIPKFMNDFKETLSLSGIKYVQEHRQATATYNSSSAEITADVFSKEIALQYGIDRSVFRDTLGLSEIDTSLRGIGGYDYLTKRLQFKFSNFLYDGKTNSVVILNLCADKVIGCQIRRLGNNVPKDKRFLTFTLDRIYKQFFKREDIQVPADLVSISTLFDIYNVNVYKPIIVTEGPMDAFLLPNAIAVSGANKKMPVELPFYYLFDADETGNKRAIEKLQQRQYVFMWGKFKSAMGLPKRTKWDVNDVVLWCKDNKPYGYKIPWTEFFSNNPLDMIYLDDIRMTL